MKKTNPQTNKQNKTKKHKLTSPSRTSVEKKMIPIVIWFGGLHRPMSINFFFFLNVMDSNNFYFLVFK